MTPGQWPSFLQLLATGFYQRPAQARKDLPPEPLKPLVVICHGSNRKPIQNRKAKRYYGVSPWPWSWSALGHLHFLQELVGRIPETQADSHWDALPASWGSGSEQWTLRLSHTLLSWMLSGPSYGYPGPIHLLIDGFLSVETPQLPWGLPSRKSGRE